MDNLWIYIGIFIILAIRGIVKTVSKQIEAEKGTTPKSNIDDIFKEEFERQMQSYNTESEVIKPRKVSKPTPPQQKKGQPAMRTILPKVHKNTKMEDNEEFETIFSTPDDIRRGIIAAEIFNRKY